MCFSANSLKNARMVKRMCRHNADELTSVYGASPFGCVARHLKHMRLAFQPPKLNTCFTAIQSILASTKLAVKPMIFPTIDCLQASDFNHGCLSWRCEGKVPSHACSEAHTNNSNILSIVRRPAQPHLQKNRVSNTPHKFRSHCGKFGKLKDCTSIDAPLFWDGTPSECNPRSMCRDGSSICNRSQTECLIDSKAVPTMTLHNIAIDNTLSCRNL